MILSPAPTDTPAASVIMMLVPVLLPVAVRMFLTNAMPARASDGARQNRRASASVARARRAGLLDESTSSWDASNLSDILARLPMPHVLLCASRARTGQPFGQRTRHAGLATARGLRSFTRLARPCAKRGPSRGGLFSGATGSVATTRIASCRLRLSQKIPQAARADTAGDVGSADELRPARRTPTAAPRDAIVPSVT